MANKVQKRIQEAYGACYHLCENDRQAEAWLTRALDAARRGEKQHRSIRSGYKLPIADAARFFAVKWFLGPDREGDTRPATFADACSLREDCLYAKGARDRVILNGKTRQWADLTEAFADVVALDYVREFTS